MSRTTPGQAQKHKKSPCFFFRWVVLRFTLSFCVVLPSFSPFWWCCFLHFFCFGGALPPPSLSEAAFSLLLFGGVSFLLFLLWVGLLSPPLLLEGAALPSLSLDGVFGWGYFSLVFCWGGAAWPPSLGAVALFPLSFCVVLPSFSPFWWGRFLSLFCLGAAWRPSLVGDALFPILLCGAAFHPLLP